MSNNKRLIAKILNGENVVMTIDDNMLSCEFGALDRGNITDVVNWGIYANRGSISFIDNVGFFNNQNVNSTEIKSYILHFYLVDKIKKTLIATFKIDSIKLEEETRQVNIELVSNLLSIGSKKIIGSVYPFYNRSVETLLSMVNEKFSFANVGIGDDSKNITYTYIDCPYIPVDTFWNVMTKLCQSTMSRIVETPSGELEITGAFPERKPICLAPNNIINVENAGFVRIENGLIDVTERTTYNNRVLDGANKNFSINRAEDGFVKGAEGFTVTNKRDDNSDYGYYREYIEGKLNFKTPYKIFKVGIDQSLVNEHVQMGTLTGNSAITEDKQYSRNSVLCSDVSILNETDISAKVNELRVSNQFTDPDSYFQTIYTQGGTFRFPVYTFIDNGTTKISITSQKDGEEIPSNDLIQRFSSFYDTESQGEIPLGEYILQEIRRRYYHGIECFEIECLFNDYYDENGNIVFDGKDLSNHFKKYDVIIPYVMKKGQKVPLRKNPDGTPKKFRIIGISYSYDGLLRQRLSVQEERYDVD